MADAENRRLFRDRLKLLVNHHGSAAALSRACGGEPSDSAIRQWLAGRAEPTREYLVKLATGGGVSAGWLAAGEGAMWPSDAAPPPALGEDFVLVPRYDIEASAGPGTFQDREHAAGHMAFPGEWVRRTLGADPRNLVLITAVGDSMEPAIRSGDLLLVDTAVRRVYDDAIYIVVNDDLLVVKRLQKFLSGVITIKSDNPSYAEETLSADQAGSLRVAGRVRWISRMI